MSQNLQTEKIPCLIDVASGRPGCALLQAAAGHRFDHRLPLSILAGVEFWVVAPTKEMRVEWETFNEWDEHMKKIQGEKR